MSQGVQGTHGEQDAPHLGHGVFLSSNCAADFVDNVIARNCIFFFQTEMSVFVMTSWNVMTCRKDKHYDNTAVGGQEAEDSPDRRLRVDKESDSGSEWQVVVKSKTREDMVLMGALMLLSLYLPDTWKG